MNPKEKVALSSIFASLVVATLKLFTGILTNSLGIISEGLHSTLDLIAVSTTYFAVKKAEMPPDHDHQYGHGKAENLASLLESALLLIVALWIFYEAFERIYVKEVLLSINLPSIIVIVIAILIDASRFRALSSTSKKYNSPALEADALHFSTDLLSTTVVMLGSILVFFGVRFMDIIAAIFVAIIILTVSFRLGRKSINILMDRAPSGISQIIKEEARKIQGVEKIDRIRVRESGSKIFIDLVLCIDKLLSLEAAHKISETLSERINSVIPNSDVVIHAEPLSHDTSNLITRIRGVASSFPQIKNIHNIKIYEVNQKLYIDFHLELDGSLTITEAHQLVSELENRIKNLDSTIASATSHFEPIDEDKLSGIPDPIFLESIKGKIFEIVKELPEIISIHNLEIRKVDGKFSISLHCVMGKSTTVQASHKVSEHLESLLRNEFKDIESVTIHIEPEKQ